VLTCVGVLWGRFVLWMRWFFFYLGLSRWIRYVFARERLVLPRMERMLLPAASICLIPCLHKQHRQCQDCEPIVIICEKVFDLRSKWCCTPKVLSYGCTYVLSKHPLYPKLYTLTSHLPLATHHHALGH